MGSKLLIAVCCLLVEKGLLASIKCQVTCKDGEYCLDTECLSCPYGTFQPEPIHSYHSCKDWTNKQTEPHYILSKAGTAVSDAVWVCEDGYEEKPYTVGGFECVKIVTTSPTVSSSTEPSTTLTTSITSITSTIPTTEPSTALLPLQQQNGGLSSDAIAGIVIGCVCLAIIVALAVYCRNKHRNDRHIKLHKWKTSEANVSVEDNSPTEPEPQTLKHYQNCYRFCFKFVEELGIVTFKKFLNVLYDPSGKFHAGNVLKSESSKTPVVKTYLVKSFLRWVELNSGIYRPLIVLALDDVGCAYALAKIEKLAPVSYKDAANIDCDESMSLLSNDRETIAEEAVMKFVRALGAYDESTSSEGRQVLRQDQFRLFYFLTKQIEAGILKTLLLQLPGSTEFNVKDCYNRQLKEENDESHAFALTVEEWWMQNPGLSLKDKIIEFVTDLGRQDLLENSEFQKRLQKIVPADTSSTGNHGQEQCHYSQNLVSDAIDSHQVSHNIDTGHMSADSEGDHVSINNEVGHLSNNTEGGHVSNNSEGDRVSNKTDGDHVSVNNQGGHVSNNTDGDHVSNNTEEGHVSNNTNGDHVTNSTDGYHESNNTDGYHVSKNTDGDHVSNNTEEGHVSNNINGIM